MSLPTADADGLPSEAAVPSLQAVEVESHPISKRQSPSTCIYFFLSEPPSSLQCNPQENNTLTLGCNFLAGRISSRMALTSGWFFSLDGVVGDLVQVSRFQTNAQFSAFENVLVVSATTTLHVLNPKSISIASLLLPAGAECSARGILLLSEYS